jgi:hypothetical protein
MNLEYLLTILKRQTIPTVRSGPTVPIGLTVQTIRSGRTSPIVRSGPTVPIGLTVQTIRSVQTSPIVRSGPTVPIDRSSLTILTYLGYRQTILKLPIAPTSPTSH